MDAANFGDGSISLRWTRIEGIGGLQPHLALRGTLTAKDYGIGSVVQITAEVSAWDGWTVSYGLIGTTAPKAYVLNWVKQQYVQANPRPEHETTHDIDLRIAMPPQVLEALEQRRQGKDFMLQMDTTILLVDGGDPVVGERRADHAGTHPTRDGQDRLSISEHDWAQVLQRWERGMGVSVLVPLPATEPNVERAGVVRRLTTARQKLDGGDYQGVFIECRQALELLRGLSPAARPLPKDFKKQDAAQRIHAVLDSLHVLASAAFHADDPIKDFVPARADAVSLIGATASVAQQVFAWLDRS